MRTGHIAHAAATIALVRHESMGDGASRVRLLAAALVCIVASVASACAPRNDPIVIGEGTLVLENQTSTEWRDVLITVNHHYRGGTRSLAAGGRLNAPLRDFQTGFGEKFDRARMSVFNVVVTAKEPNGTPVRIEWDKGVVK